MQASEILGSCMSRLQYIDQVPLAIKKDMPLTGCTYSFVTVSLDNTRKVVIDNDNDNQSDEVLQKSTIEAVTD